METVSEVRRARRLRLVPMAVALVAMFVGLVWAPTASAASDPIASGTTTITLNKGLYKQLKRNGVKVLKVKPATVKKRKATLPVSGGSVDPTTGAGTVNHSGGIKFKKGKRSVALKNFVLNTTTASLSGKAGRTNLKIASVKGVTFTRNGFGVDIRASNLKLTGKAAKTLNKKLGLKGKKRLKGNKSLGASSSTTQPSTVTVVPGGAATLFTSLPTVLKFVDVGVDFVPIAPTSKDLLVPPTFTFPIGGGTIAPDASAGTVQTLGGVRLVQKEFVPGLQVSITLGALWVDLTTKVATAEITIDSTDQAKFPTPGNVGRSSIANLDLSGATISSDPVNRTVSIINAKATLQAVTAATLNSVFAEPILRRGNVFVEGDSLGTFSFTAHTQ